MAGAKAEASACPFHFSTQDGSIAAGQSNALAQVGGSSSGAGGKAEASDGGAPGIVMPSLLVCGEEVRPGSNYCPYHRSIAYISLEQDRRNRAMTTAAVDTRRRKGMGWPWKAA